ncbi:MAG: hypothetical protein JKX73_04850 [Flavobacteriales bacterium]|nr:hypothetical protein [Flavobacteriales bacterium]
MDITKLSIKIPLFWCLGTILLLSSCLKGTEYPDEPVIELISMEFTDSIEPLLGNKMYIGIITFGFTDGDGNIGVHPNDSTENMVVYEYGVVNGIDQAPIDLSYSIPYVTPTGQNKSIKGEIDVELFLEPAPPKPHLYDTVYFELFIKDRSNNKSNIITTRQIVLSNL